LSPAADFRVTFLAPNAQTAILLFTRRFPFDSWLKIKTEEKSWRLTRQLSSGDLFLANLFPWRKAKTNKSRRCKVRFTRSSHNNNYLTKQQKINKTFDTVSEKSTNPER